MTYMDTGRVHLRKTGTPYLLFGRGALEHTSQQTGRNTWADRLESFYPQAATQWDGLRPIRHRVEGSTVE